MLGLIFLQFQWIHKATELQENRLRDKIALALQRSAERIEQADMAQESAQFILNKVLDQKPDSSLVQMLVKTSHFKEMNSSHNFANLCVKPLPVPDESNNIGYRLTEAQAAAPYLGIQFSQSDAGVLVKEVVAGSPAEEAGLRRNDIITAINEQSIDSSKSLMTLLQSYQAGEDIRIAYKRYASKEQLSYVAQATLQDANFQKNLLAYQRLAIKVAYDQKPIQNRISLLAIDSIVRTTFEEMKIHHPYELSVSKNNKLLYNNGSILRKAPQPRFEQALFSESKDSHSTATLQVHFTNMSSYDWKSSNYMLVLSLLFNLIIIGIFAYTVHTIVQQKKLADIKSDFINNMTHELKTPLATIRLATEMLTDHSLPRTEQNLQRYTRMIAAENQRLQNHVERVLQFARLEKNSLDLQLQTTDLHKLLDEILPKILLQIENLHGTLQYLPEARHSTVLADTAHITNVLYNLLDNAIKYSDKTPQISVVTKNRKNYIDIYIKDQGIGMSREAISKIFDQFYRIPTGNIHNVKGFGIGLSYVKLMTEAHKGSISVQSKPQKGSTFVLSLPVM